MSDIKKSQEDKDKLLKGEEVVREDGNISPNVEQIAVEEHKSQVEILKEEKEKIKNKDLTNEEKDALGEIANISFGSASTTLSTALNKQVMLTTPRVDVVRANMINKNEAPFVVLTVNYVKGLDINNLLVIKKEVAHVIANLMMGGTGLVEEGKEIDEMELSAVQEAMNQMMGAAATSMSEVFGRMVNISPPTILVMERNEIESHKFEEEKYVTITFDLEIEGAVSSQLVQVMTVDNARKMAKELMTNMNVASSLDEVKETITEGIDVVNKNNLSIVEAGLSLQGEISPLLKDAKVKVEVIFGNTQKPLKEILAMSEDDIIALQEEVGEFLKIYANGVMIAEGEIVNIDGHFGVEIKKIKRV